MSEELIAQLVTFVGGTAVVGALIVWLLKKIAEQFLASDLEKYKMQLKTASEKEVELVRHDLQLASIAHEQTWRVLQARRAKVVEKVHSLLLDYLAAAERYASIIWFGERPPRQVLAEEMDTASKVFFAYYSKHKIYLTAETAALIDKAREAVRGPLFDFSVRDARIAKGGIGEDHEKHMQAWEKAHLAISKDAAPIVAAIQEEFRIILGVKEVESKRVE